MMSILQVGTGITNLLIATRKVIDKTYAGESEDVPILSTSVAYGVYMAVSSNLRYIFICDYCCMTVFPEGVCVLRNFHFTCFFFLALE